MLRLLIKQGPFYISSFTALFLAMSETGWLDRMFPAEEAAAPAEESCFIAENGEELCFTILPMMLEGPDSLEFVEASAQFYQEPWFVVLALVVGTLILGFLARKAWEFVFE